MQAVEMYIFLAEQGWAKMCLVSLAGLMVGRKPVKTAY